MPCHNCGIVLPLTFLQVARHCKNSLLNLVPLCPECNRVKSDWVRPIV